MSWRKFVGVHAKRGKPTGFGRIIALSKGFVEVPSPMLPEAVIIVVVSSQRAPVSTWTSFSERTPKASQVIRWKPAQA